MSKQLIDIVKRGIGQVFIYHLIFWLIFISIVPIASTTILENFSTEQQLTIGLLVFSVYLWVTSPIPTGAISILILASMLILNLVDSVEEAVVGFLSPALYFIFMLTIISQSLVKIGVDRAVAIVLVKLSKGGPHFIIFGLPVFICLLPIFMPSAFARFKMLLPIINRLNEYYGYSEKSLFKKYCLYVIGMMNQKATMIIFTGGGFPILASQLFDDYQIANLGWMEWFIKVAPPLWVSMFIVNLFVWRFLKWITPNESTAIENTVSNYDQKPETLSIKFWIVTGSFLLMILTWVLFDHDQIPLLLPPMLLVVFYSLPKLGLIDNQAIRNFDWENFLLLGSSFSIGILLESNGTANALAKELIAIFPQDTSTVVKVIGIAFFIFVLRLLFIVPSSALIVIFPIVISYAELIGITPIGLAFLVVMIIGGVMILPIHSPVSYFAYETGIFKRREQYIIGIVSSFVMMVVSILATLYFW
ncbi:SLC13 family permease [Virgibacillus ndiopensis]|uniref:SLC13 family permease n=1 Tax=Virgibacillus ndiopensis TaxID=2004408 RepID=UPI001145B268|nr:SLC13 family permease [Virgibacillus ndiopensis]